MPKTKLPRKPGRLPLEQTLLDGNGDSRFWEIAAGMFRLQCNIGEVAAVLRCTIKSFNRACRAAHNMPSSEFRARCMQHGHARLRRKQWEVAMQGDRQMLIWLGKQYLGQKDAQAITHEVKDVEQMDDEQLMRAVPKALRALGYDDTDEPDSEGAELPN